MAHFINEKVSVNRIIKELKDNTKKPILKNKLEEIEECKQELLKMTIDDLIKYKIYLESVLDKLTNISFFIGTIAFSGIAFSILAQFFLKIPDLLLGSMFLVLLGIVVFIVMGGYQIITRNRSSLVLTLKIIDLILNTTKNNEID